MSKQYCLYLTNCYLAIYAAGSGGLQRLFSASFNDRNYVDNLQNFLAENRLDLIRVFIDVMGEEIKHERIPHINPADRQRLIKRKLKSLFPNADLIWQQHLKRDKSGRKDDIFLFLGTNLPDAVRCVLDLLTQTEQRVYGLYFQPLLQQQVVNILPGNYQYLIISGIVGNLSYRQTFFKEKTLAVSRVTSTAGETRQVGLDQLFKETVRTYQYLEGSRQLNPNQPLNVIIMLDEDAAAYLVGQSTNLNIDLKFAGLNELGEKLGVGANHQSLPELLCHMAICKNLKPHFQPVDICHRHRVEVRKRGLTFATAAVLLVSLLISAGLWLSAQQANERYAQIAAGVTETERQRNILAERLPATQVPPGIMQQSVQLYRDISKNNLKPEHILPILARAYEGHQDLELKRITWGSRPVQHDDNSDEGYSAPGNSDFMAALRKPIQLKLVVSPDLHLSTRAMLAGIDSFSRALQQQPEISQVILEKSAIDTRSSAQMEESFGGSAEQQTADFTLLITL